MKPVSGRPGCKWTSPYFLSAGGKLLILYLYCLRERLPRQEQRGGVYGLKVFSAVLLQGGEVYKRLRSQVRGSQRSLCRCLRSALKAVLVPCTYEHNIILYIIFQLCEDVFYLQIKSTGNGLAQSGDDGYTLQYSQSHRDYLAQGSYYLIEAQIDYCLVLLKLMFMLCSCTKGVFPP